MGRLDYKMRSWASLRRWSLQEIFLLGVQSAGFSAENLKEQLEVNFDQYLRFPGFIHVSEIVF